jgi:D-3-phosphoglycerate dehydrogenase / 2-oxoglutarate reductase
MTRPTVLLTHGPGALAHYYGPRALAGLEALADVKRRPDDTPCDEAALIAAAQGCHVIVSDRSAAAGAQVFERLPDLIAVCRCAVDIRNIDVAAASAQGVLVTQASAGFMTAVAEWIVGAMIDLSRHISRAVHAYRSGETPPITMGRELRGATLGIVGYGQIGRCLADVAHALGMQVQVHDPHVAVAPAAMRQVGLDALLADSDYVVCLALATPATENLFGAPQFAAMKRDAIFINASRGQLVDEDALLHALDAGRIAGCALDVGRAPDQMPSPALARHPRVVATPHIGGLTPPAIEHQALETVRQVASILQGQFPPGAVNPAHARRLHAWHAARFP